MSDNSVIKQTKRLHRVKTILTTHNHLLCVCTDTRFATYGSTPAPWWRPTSLMRRALAGLVSQTMTSLLTAGKNIYYIMLCCLCYYVSTCLFCTCIISLDTEGWSVTMTSQWTRLPWSTFCPSAGPTTPSPLDTTITLAWWCRMTYSATLRLAFDTLFF